MKFVDTKSYFKNVAKSVNYTVDDILKENHPALYNMKHIKSSFTNAQSDIRKIFIDSNRIENTTQTRQSEDVEMDDIFKNAVKDLKSGNFYNKARQKKMFSSKEHQSSFDMSFSDSLDNFGSSLNGITSSLARQTQASASIAKTQIKANRSNMMFEHLASNKRHMQSMQLNNTINENLSNLVTFNNDKFSPFMDQSLRYYQDSIIEQRKMTTLLSEMRDMQYNSTNIDFASKHKTGYEKIFSSGGMDFAEYFKYVAGNVKNNFMGGPSLDIDKGPGWMEKAAASPISFMLSTAYNLATPDYFKKSMKGLEKSAIGLPAALILSLNNIENNKSLNKLSDKVVKKLGDGILASMLGTDKDPNASSKLTGAVAGIIKSVLGVSNAGNTYDLGNYHKGPMQFNGIAHRAITNVIPTLLGKIYTTLAGYKDDVIVDYNQGGKIIWAKRKQEDVSNTYRNAVSSSMPEFNKGMQTRFNNTNMSESQRKDLDNEYSNLLLYLANGNKLDYNDPNFAKKLKDKGIAPKYADYLVNQVKQLPLPVLNYLSYEQIKASMAMKNVSKDFERDADLSGLVMLNAFSDMDNKASRVKLKFDVGAEKSLIDTYSKKNSDYNEDLEKYAYKPTDTSSLAANTGNRLQLNTTVGILNSIRRILVDGIIVYPMKRIPSIVRKRSTDIKNEIANYEREQSTRDTLQRDEASRLNKTVEELRNSNGNQFDDLNDPKLTEVINKRVIDMEAALNGDIPQSEKSGNRILDFFANLVQAPMRAGAFVIGGVNKLVNRVIFGADSNNRGLVDTLFDKFNGLRNKFKNWFGNKADKARDKFSVTSLGKQLKNKAKGVKDFFTKDSMESFAGGFKSVFDEMGMQIRDMGRGLGSIADTLFGKYRDKVTGENKKFTEKFKPFMGDAVAGAGMGVIGSMFLPGGPLIGGLIGGIGAMTAKTGDLQKFLFGDDEKGKSGLIHKDYLKWFKSLGFDTKQSSRVFAGGALGMLGSLFMPGGPLLWGMVGASNKFIGASEGLQKLLYGDLEYNEHGIAIGRQNNGLLPAEIKTALPDMKQFGSLGLVGGLIANNFLPGGPVTGALVGSSLGYLKDKDFFKKMMWGDSEKNTKGIMTKVGDVLYDNIGFQVENFMRNQFAKFGDTLTRNVFLPLKESIQPLSKSFMKATTSIAKVIGKKMDAATNGLISKIAGLLFTTVRSSILGVGNVIGAGARTMISAPGKLLSVGNTILAKYGMNEDEYNAWNQKRIQDRQDSKRRRDEKLLETKSRKKEYIDAKRQGLSYSEYQVEKSQKAMLTSTKDTGDKMVKAVKSGMDRMVSAVIGLPAPKAVDNNIVGDSGFVDEFIGRDVAQLTEQARQDKNDKVLQEIATNTSMTARGLGGLLSGDGKKGTSLWDTIKGIFGNLGGILSTAITTGGVVFGAAKLLQNISGNDGDVVEGTKDFVTDVATTSWGMKQAHRMAKFAQGAYNTASSIKNSKVGKAVGNVVGRATSKVGSLVKSGTSYIGKRVKDTKLGKSATKIAGKSVEVVTDIASKFSKKFIELVQKFTKIKTQGIGKKIASLLKYFKQIAPELGKKVAREAAKVSGKVILDAIAKLTVIAEAVLVVTDVVTGYNDYRSILNIPEDTPFDWVMATSCSVFRALNGFLAAGLLPEKWCVELFLRIVGKGNELDKLQEKFEKDAADAGFSGNTTAYNRYKNPTMFQKFGAALGLADTSRDVAKKRINNLKEIIATSDDPEQVAKATADMEKAIETLKNTKKVWYETLGDWFSNMFNWNKDKDFNSKETTTKTSVGGKTLNWQQHHDHRNIGGAEHMEDVTVKYANPVKEGTYKRISSEYGYRTWVDGSKEFHDGIDFAAPVGTPIYAVNSGTAYSVKTGYNGGWGDHIRIKHDDGYETIYAHANKLDIKEGQTVQKGQKIAEVGSSGRSTGPHLHFGVYKQGDTAYGKGVNPSLYLGSAIDGITPSNNDTLSAEDAKATEISGTGDTADGNFLTKIMGEISNFFTASITGQAYTPLGSQNTLDPSTTDITAPTNTGTGTGNDYLGKVTAKWETGIEGGDPGMVSNGNEWGDPGGISYGIPQYTTNTGSAKSFVEEIMTKYPVYKKYFENKQPGTRAFGDSWKKAYADRGWEFGALQLKTAYDNYYSPFIKGMKNMYNVDMNKDRARQEAGYSMAVQHGSGSYKKYGEGLNSGMSTKDLLNKLYSNRINKANYPTLPRWNDELALVQTYADKPSIAYGDKMVNKYLKPDAMGGIAPKAKDIDLNAIGGVTIDTDMINDTVDKYYNEVSKQISTTLDADSIVNSANSNIPYDQIISLLANIADNTSATVRGLATVGTAMVNAVTTTITNTTNNATKETVTKSHVSGSNIFMGDVEKARETSTNMLKRRIDMIAKGN